MLHVAMFSGVCAFVLFWTFTLLAIHTVFAIRRGDFETRLMLCPLISLWVLAAASYVTWILSL